MKVNCACNNFVTHNLKLNTKLAQIVKIRIKKVKP